MIIIHFGYDDYSIERLFFCEVSRIFCFITTNKCECSFGFISFLGDEVEILRRWMRF